MIVEYKKLKYGYSLEGWEKAYKEEYKDVNKLRLKLLIEDEAIGQVLREIYKIMLGFRIASQPIELLDVGCGVGHQISSIAHLCDNAVGFDISSEVIKQNSKLDCSVTFVQGDALSHPSLDRKFNIVLMAGVLYAIGPERETHRRILSEAFDSLDDDGYFVFYHRAYLNALTYLDKTVMNLLKKWSRSDRGDYYMCWFDDAYILKLVKDIGFEVVRVDKADFAYSMSSTFFRMFFLKRKYHNYEDYKSYNNYEKDYDSYNRLNFFGKIVYVLSRHMFNSLTARTSIFILHKQKG